MATIKVTKEQASSLELQEQVKEWEDNNNRQLFFNIQPEHGILVSQDPRQGVKK